MLRRLKEKGIHTASETTGFAKQEVFEKYIQQVDLLYFDVKHHDELQHKRGTKASLAPILNNLKFALKHHDNLIVRIPVIPDFNDGPENAEAFAQLFNQLGIQQIELLPFHQFGEKKYAFLDREYPMQDIPQLHTEDLTYFKEILDAHHITCQVH